MSQRWLALLIVVWTLTLIPTSTAQASDSPTQVTVTIAVVNFGNYDAKQGTYVLDFYLVFRWDPAHAPANFTADSFEMANGRATSRELQLDQLNVTTGQRELWYRVQANLYSEPQYGAYPFDKQTVEVRLEDTVYAQRQLVYIPDQQGSRLQDNFKAAGWQVREASMTVESHAYSFDEPYSQAHFAIVLQRSVLSGVLKVILPPLAFIIISGVTFFLVGADKIATRFGLSANMAISGVMFHAGQSASLPSLSRLIFLDRYMLAVDTFLFGSVLVTALVALVELKFKDATKAKKANLRGAILVPVVSVAVFLLLFLVK